MLDDPLLEFTIQLVIGPEAADLTDAVDRLLAAHHAAEGIARVGGIGHHAPVPQDLDPQPYCSRS